MKITSFPSNNIQALSSPPIDSNSVKDLELRKTVESIGPTRWWENNTKGNTGYSFEVKGAEGSSFQVGMDGHRNIFQFWGRVPYNGSIQMYSDTSQLTDTSAVLEAISKPSAKEIIEAFHTIVGLSENK